MKFVFAALTALSATTLISSSASAGTITVVNNTGEDIQVSCSHANSFEVHRGQSRRLSYGATVQNVNCSAQDHNGKHYGGGNFHFDNHHDMRVWVVEHH